MLRTQKLFQLGTNDTSPTATSTGQSANYFDQIDQLLTQAYSLCTFTQYIGGKFVQLASKTKTNFSTSSKPNMIINSRNTGAETSLPPSRKTWKSSWRPAHKTLTTTKAKLKKKLERKPVHAAEEEGGISEMWKLWICFPTFYATKFY